jgi:hypothetical protein
MPRALVGPGEVPSAVPRYEQVAERPSFDAYEEAVGSEDEPERAQREPTRATAGLFGSYPLQTRLVEVAVVDRRERKAPSLAPLDCQAFRLDKRREAVARVAAHVTRPVVARTEVRWIGRNGDGHNAARAEDAHDLVQGGLVVLDVLQYLAEHGCIECAVGERQFSRISLQHLAPDAPPQQLDGLRRRVETRDLEAAPLQNLREAALTSTGVQDEPARSSPEEQLEEQALPQPMARPHEIGVE